MLGSCIHFICYYKQWEGILQLYHSSFWVFWILYFFRFFCYFLFAYSFVGIFGISPVGQLKQTNNFSECLPSHQSNFSVIRSLLVATHINKQRCLELWMGWICLHIVNCLNALAFLHSFLPPLQFWHLFPTVLILHFLCSSTLFPWLCFISLKTFALDFATCLTGEKPSAGTDCQWFI